MVYLSAFVFPDENDEHKFFSQQRRTCYDSSYPFRVFAPRGLRRLEFEPVTILYGTNGSGKTTALNVMAEALRLSRRTPFNRTDFWPAYLNLCDAEVPRAIPSGSQILCSDDVFDAMLDLRALNDGIDTRRAELFKEYTDAKYSQVRLRSLDDVEQLRRTQEARTHSQSQFVRRNLTANARTWSNGETALQYFQQQLRGDALYLLDEPENSLSAAKQQELAQFLVESARFFGCQLIIATHSPFLLAMPGAKVYDLDSTPVLPRRWTELDAVRAYRAFFQAHEKDF